MADIPTCPTCASTFLLGKECAAREPHTVFAVACGVCQTTYLCKEESGIFFVAALSEADWLTLPEEQRNTLLAVAKNIRVIPHPRSTA